MADWDSWGSSAPAPPPAAPTAPSAGGWDDTPAPPAPQQPPSAPNGFQPAVPSTTIRPPSPYSSRPAPSTASESPAYSSHPAPTIPTHPSASASAFQPPSFGASTNGWTSTSTSSHAAIAPAALNNTTNGWVTSTSTSMSPAHPSSVNPVTASHTSPPANGWGNAPSHQSFSSPAHGQERREPPVYAFAVPAEARGYVIGAQGANLIRISEETGIRVTRAKPRQDGSDPTERDLLFFNDDNRPLEKVELALVKIVSIVRRKINDWLPTEGRAAEDARRLLAEGKFEDSGSSPRHQFPHSGTNGYQPISDQHYSNTSRSATQTTSPQNGSASAWVHSSSGPAVNDDLPSQVGPFRDPASPSNNWAGVPAPTFTQGPRSTVSGHSHGLPSRQQDTQATSNGWKPDAPTFVPRFQAGHPGQAEPAISLNTFLAGAAGSKWAAEHLPTPAASIAPRSSEVVTPFSTAASHGRPSHGPISPVSGNPEPSRATSSINGWVVKGSQAPPASKDHVSTPTLPHQSSISSNGHSMPAQPAPSTGSGWDDVPTSSSTSINQHAHTPNGLASNAPASPVSASVSNQSIRPTSSVNGWIVKGSQAPSLADVDPPRREETPRPFAQQAPQLHAIPHNRQTSGDSGWEESPDPVKQVADPIASMQVSQQAGWGATPQEAQKPQATIEDHRSPAGVGWGEPDSNSGAVSREAEHVAAPTRDSWGSLKPETVPDNRAPAAGVGWGEPNSDATSEARGQVPQPTAPTQGSWGAPRPDTHNAGRSDVHSNTPAGDPYSNGPRPDAYGNGSGGNSYSGGNGYSGGNSYSSGGGGNYGGYGPPAERRFPGAGGSWASGPNEIPLRHNKWQSGNGRRPGEDLYRPAVPQAIPGSGW